jgi:hypothetical protein
MIYSIETLHALGITSLYFYFNQSSVNFICSVKPAEKWNEMEFFEDLQRIARPIMKKEATTYNDNCLFFYDEERSNGILIETNRFHW